MRFYFLPLLVLCLRNASAWDEDEEDVTQCFVRDEIKFINTLGFKIQNLIISHPGNSFISPVGIAFSLGVIHLGAAGPAAQQLEDVLSSQESGFSVQKFHKSMKTLRDELQSNGRNFSIFSGFFIQEGCGVNTEFADSIKEFYEAEIFEVNFTNNSEFSSEDINDYARNKTNGKFEAMLTEKVPNITQSLLLNAVDFNDAWKVQFPVESTKRDYFYSGKRETTEVWMMSTEVETFRFYEDLELKYKFLELPYKDEKMSMILALPIQYDQPANLQIDGDMLCDIKSKLISTKLDMVAIPRMKFELQTNLKEVLIDVGVKDVFHSFDANFSGICDTNDFYIDDIVQKTLVEVDEEGNNAATITKLKFLPLAFRGVKEFIANHPFQFYVQDKISGVILVAGRVDEPSESISLSENLRFI